LVGLLVVDLTIVQCQATQTCAKAVAHVDLTYGGKIRRIAKSDSHLHNINFWNPLNANNAYLIGVQSNLEQRDWRMELYDGNGCFIKDLFSIAEYDWRLVWGHSKPDLLYTSKGSNLYRYNVTTPKGNVLKALTPLSFNPGSPALNQAGDRIMVVTSDGLIRSYRLADMGDQRAFDTRLSHPAGCTTDRDDIRYTGYRNYIGVNCTSRDDMVHALVVYDDTAALVHTFYGFAGNYDFSPHGKLAYVEMWGSGKPLEIHVVNIDRTNDQILYSLLQSNASYVQNLHVSWPDKVDDWFIASIFPSARHLPSTYASPLDEILIVTTSGSHKYLARTETSIATRWTDFWAQPLASPSSDGSRVSFNSNRSGIITHYLLWVPITALSK
jgi:hypothetical protein